MTARATRTRRRPRIQEENERKILAAALDVFSDKGFRGASLDDIAAMAVWLASDEAAFATGQMFTIDGGMTAASPLNPGLF